MATQKNNQQERMIGLQINQSCDNTNCEDVLLSPDEFDKDSERDTAATMGGLETGICN
ncbi:MAG: hypothetical protein WCW65_00820 [Candidatus Paceibacterota bacterium]